MASCYPARFQATLLFFQLWSLLGNFKWYKTLEQEMMLWCLFTPLWSIFIRYQPKSLRMLNALPCSAIKTPSFASQYILPHNIHLPLSWLTTTQLPWWFSGKESACQCRSCEFDSWLGKISWRRKWQPTLVLVPGKSYGQRGAQWAAVCRLSRVRHDFATKQHITPHNICLPLNGLTTTQAKCNNIPGQYGVRVFWLAHTCSQALDNNCGRYTWKNRLFNRFVHDILVCTSPWRSRIKTPLSP